MKSNLKFKINDDGYLLVSYDAGCTWEIIGPVRGDASVVPGPQGETGPTGADGTDGVDGEDGFSPYIDEETGEWVDKNGLTGVKAVGEYTKIEIATDASTAQPGTPSVETERDGDTVTLTFKHLKGEKGDTGSRGETGATGPQGEQGEQGAPGEGVNWVESREYCALKNDAFIDAEGDMYVRVTPAIDEETQEEIPWDEAEYVCYGNMRGPQGPQGPQGIQGPPMYFTSSVSYDSQESSIIFNIDGANPGDYLAYIGDDYVVGDTVLVPSGEIFKRSEGLDDYNRQIWVDQNFSIKGPKGDVLNAEGIIPAFRLVENTGEGSSQLQVSFDNVVWTAIGNLPSKGIVSVAETDFSTSTRRVFRIDYTDGTYYDMVFDFTGMGGGSTYIAGDGIDISPNSSGSNTVKALVDNDTIKFDSEGRLYATGSGSSGGGDATIVTYFNTASEDSSEGLRISTILSRFFGTSADMTSELVGSHDISYAGISSEQARNILRGHTKNVMIKVPGDRSFRDEEELPMFIPATIINDNEYSPSESCLLFGVGYKAQTARVVNSTSTTVTQEIGTNSAKIGLSPVLYFINLVYDEVMQEYAFYGFVAYPKGNFGLFGEADTI